jgi:hypothetical protein
VDDRLLWPLRVAQELHEYAYAALHLPVWSYVPDAAMQSLFPRVDAVDPDDVVDPPDQHALRPSSHSGVDDV